MAFRGRCCAAGRRLHDGCVFRPSSRNVMNTAMPGSAGLSPALVSADKWRKSDYSFADFSDRSVSSAALAATAALAACAAAYAKDQQLHVRCEGGLSSVRCESIAGTGSIITFKVNKDRPDLLAEVTDILEHKGLSAQQGNISTEEGGARHTYSVQEKVTGQMLSTEKLLEVQKALESLKDVECRIKDGPLITRAEVERHTTPETGIWVTWKSGVYDVTDFVANHPGGRDKIMLAAGKSIDPFWRIYQMHEGRGTAVSMLEKMRIGDLADPVIQTGLGDDPYVTDPTERHPGLIFHNKKPCNAEVPPELIMDSWLTPNPVWFIRHHHPVPVVDPEKFCLTVEGGSKTITLTLDDLKSRFLKREVTSTIQCGGNRRSELDKIEKTSGIPWGTGAMSNAKWGGVYLREVLMHCAGISLEGIESAGIRHVVCVGMDDMQASIPIEKALSPFGDVLLAYEMNGEELPAEHGAPVRLIAPGVVGVRNVKWVSQIKLSKEEAEGPWQRGIAYKGFSPMQKDCKGVDVEKILSMQEMPVQSTIVSPKPGATVELDDVEVKGWAWSGGGRGIVRVDVSADGGVTWMTAELGEGSEQHPGKAWAWTFWEASVPVPACQRGKEVTILCRATDAAYSTQPESAAPLWNLRGLNCNCWHRVSIQHLDE